MSRPKKEGKKGETKSVYFPPEALEIIERNGYQSNLSAFIAAMVMHSDRESPPALGVKIEELSKEISHMEEALNLLRTKRDMMQAKLNVYRVKVELKDETASVARSKILASWKNCAKDKIKGSFMFRGWLSGPANIELIAEAGFSDEDAVIEWCRSQEARQ